MAAADRYLSQAAASFLHESTSIKATGKTVQGVPAVWRWTQSAVLSQLLCMLFAEAGFASNIGAAKPRLTITQWQG